MNARISVAIPVYNCEKYIEKCLDSIKNQTYKNYEVIISNDASTDNTMSIIEKYKKNNPQMDIVVINNIQNVGVCENRNILINSCNGEYITFVDNDDYIENNCLEVLINIAKKEEADWVIGEFRNVDENGKIIQEQKLPSNPSKWICGYHHGCLYKNEVIKNNKIVFKECRKC